jgi:hypothetical protein
LPDVSTINLTDSVEWRLVADRRIFSGMHRNRAPMKGFRALHEKRILKRLSRVVDDAGYPTVATNRGAGTGWIFKNRDGVPIG